MILTENEKSCAKCKKIKLKEEFNKDKQKRDGLRNYCKVCEKELYEDKKFKKAMGDIEENVTKIIDVRPISEEVETKDIAKYDSSVDHLAKLVSKQYGQDIKKSDEVYDLFYNLIAGGDRSAASKEALTKSLELRMSASDSLIKLIQTATKLQESREKSGGKNKLNIKNIKDDFDLD